MLSRVGDRSTNADVNPSSGSILHRAYISVAKSLNIVGLALMITLSPLLTAISSPIHAAGTEQGSSQDGAQDTSPNATASGESVIQRIRDRGNTLVVGIQYDFPPYEFIGEDGQATGFHVALIRAMAAKWGVDVEFVPVTPSDRLQKLQAGVVDIVPLEESSIDSLQNGNQKEIQDKNQSNNSVAVSNAYLQDRIGVLVQIAGGVEGIDTLDGKNVAIVTGSGADMQLSSSQAVAAESARVAIGGMLLNPLPFREYGPGLSALRAGQVDAALGPERFLAYRAKQVSGLKTIDLNSTPGSSQISADEARIEEYFVLGLSSADQYFRGLVDFTLHQLWQEKVLLEVSLRWLDDEGNGELASINIGKWPYTFADSPVDLSDTRRTPSGKAATLETILERGRLIVGIPYDLAPFGFVSDEGAAIGFGADIARAFALRWLGDSQAIELVPVTAQTRLPLLAAGAVDLVVAPITPQWADETAVDFSTPLLWDKQTVLVQSKLQLQSFEDLEGQNIAIVSGSRAETLIRAQADSLGIQIFLLPFQEYSSAFQSLRAEQVVAVAGPSLALTSMAAQDDTLKTVDVGPSS